MCVFSLLLYFWWMEFKLGCFFPLNYNLNCSNKKKTRKITQKKNELSDQEQNTNQAESWSISLFLSTYHWSIYPPLKHYKKFSLSASAVTLYPLKKKCISLYILKPKNRFRSATSFSQKNSFDHLHPFILIGQAHSKSKVPGPPPSKKPMNIYKSN